MIADPTFLHTGDSDRSVVITGNIDQGGATSENNRAAQLNVNIIITKDLNPESMEKILRSIKNVFGDQIHTVMI